MSLLQSCKNTLSTQLFKEVLSQTYYFNTPERLLKIIWYHLILTEENISLKKICYIEIQTFRFQHV